MDKTIIDNGFYILRYKNEDDKILKYQEAVSQEFIQFHFCQKDRVTLSLMGKLSASSDVQKCDFVVQSPKSFAH